MGISSGSVVVPILSELVQAVKDEMGPRPGANEKASALFALFSACGSILGTIIGPLMYNTLGNRVTCDVFSLLSFLTAIVFFMANIKPGFLIKKKPLTEAGNAVAYNNQRVS